MIIELPGITLFAVGPHNPQGTIRAIEICKREIKFGAEVVITDRSIFPGTTREEGRRNYSEFMIKEAAKYIHTSHVLIVSDDGYIQNSSAWNNEWLKWDYLGAAWDFYNVHQNGNGGFSLRSKRLCDILARDPFIDDYMPEDDKICRKYRPYLEETYGIQFAPVELCKKFSIEAWGLKSEYQVYGGEFGFHGFSVRNLPIPPIR